MRGSERDKTSLSEQDQSMSGRFKHLLEPIRDLASNWNVDIAHDLEEYLNELEMLQISLDGGNTIMNFAEAALLIQGSTCVYSRKVEYLHRLVFAVLEIITDRQQKRKDDAEEEENEPEKCFADEVQFIALDDIREAKSSAIDLVEAEDDGENVKSNQNSMLLMLSLDVDNENPDPNKDLRLSTATVHSSGALLLDSSMQGILDNKLERSLEVEKLRSEEKAFNDPNITNIAKDQTVDFDVNFDHEDEGDDDDDGYEDAAGGMEGMQGWKAEDDRKTARGHRVEEASDPWRMLVDLWSYQTRSLKLPFFHEFSKKLQLLEVEEDEYDMVDLPAAGEKPLEYEDMCGGVDDDDDGDGGWDNDFVNGEDSCPFAGNGDVGTEEGPETFSAALHKKATQEPDIEFHDDLTYEQMCKVREWQSKVEPKLQEEDKRPAFDIHSYGETVKGRVAREVKAVEEVVPFENIVHGMSRFDVCRTFLATLQLVNDGNLSITPSSRGSIDVQLLCEESKHKTMVESYMAPSIASAKKKKQKPAQGPLLDPPRMEALVEEVGGATQQSQQSTQLKQKNEDEVVEEEVEPRKKTRGRGKENARSAFAS
ncbi:hypothetical protein GUITHDRAFT_148517 [Guillardia theta CCMP2712]|uniref:Condensin-2 complex subunit H2 n=1 Tax=Guillardia theta (strain CCMP2712) TaxID=905079 RepID=L1I8P6_GUITC|nr:hypothetical protein GUITHDRAFT_148517 [Guillardia theta CCMP2712]EKX32603.1 hypothetical protein GUITHDRAFT_148517 [Guillardia theta CCMP2712]|eukprot:XP_005819583.1 hypothetical protein GUITHDRAFT_148517 [Guillardia theta CCMP2712]